MNKNYQKVIFSAIIVIILMIWNFNYSYIYLIGFMIAMLFIVYDTNRYYQQQINFYKREKENEIREVEGEKDFNHKILNSLIKTMNLPMIFVNKEGTIIFTNQSFRDAFKIKHLRGKYYKDIFTDQLLNIVDQSYIFERKFSTAVCIDERYYNYNNPRQYSVRELHYGFFFPHCIQAYPHNWRHRLSHSERAGSETVAVYLKEHFLQNPV